jgi:putative redox protein
MVESSIVYEGGLRCVATHGPSQTQITTDAPVDNHGKGEAFSPTDLVGAAVGACMLTIAGIYADRKSIDLRGSKVSVRKHMTTTPPRRIAKFEVDFTLSLPESHPDVPALKQAMMQCPVFQSLHPDVEKQVVFRFAE